MAAVPELIAEDFGGGRAKAAGRARQFPQRGQDRDADNLKFSEKLRTLFTGEGSNTHVNNFRWATSIRRSSRTCR